MPYIIALLGLMAGSYFWIIHGGATADAMRRLTGQVQARIAAARRFALRRRAGIPFVNSLDKADV
ncbi:hypothetical protein [Rhodobacter calidifons]|uniref:Uncharacterized protein n=1 Tax=Rhodobacter calidifons TaxID=2715277 RepID=A0ABX0GA83_9RHOB|nr:hypothetical protein [Rhodobacter calidifons]NHB78205.1 hypothetical protein [Rhodobacter calidifons]